MLCVVGLGVGVGGVLGGVVLGEEGRELARGLGSRNTISLLSCCLCSCFGVAKHPREPL